MTFRERMLGAFGGVPTTRVPELVQAGLEPMRAEIVATRQIVEAEMRDALTSYGQQWIAGIEDMLKGHGLGQYRKAAFSNHYLTYACMRLIAQAVAAVPFKLWTRVPVGQGRQQVLSHPILDRLANPFPEFYSDGCQFVEMLVLYMLGGGNAWLLLDEPDRKTKVPASVAAFGSYHVAPVIDRISGKLLAWKFKFGQQAERLFPPDELHQVKFSNPDDQYGILGIGPVQAAQSRLDSSFARERYDAAFFINGAEPGVVLKFNPTELGLKKGLTRDDMMVARELWRDEHEGPDKAHKVGMLNAGWSLEKTGMSQRDMQFIQAALFDLRAIGFVFGVPSVKLNDFEHAGLSREGFEIGNRAMAEDVTVPLCRRLSGFLDRVLVQPVAPDLQGAFDTDEIPALREDMDRKIDRAVKLVSIGVSLNKALKATDTGIDPEPWGDEALVPSTDVPASLLSDMNELPTSPAATVPKAAQVASLRRLRLAQAVARAEREHRNGDPESPKPTAAEEREATRAAHWRGFVTTFAPLEGRYLKKIRQYFRSLQRETIDNLSSEGGRSAGSHTRAIDIRRILFDLEKADARLRKFSEPYFEQAIIIGSNGASAEMHTDAIGIESPAAQEALAVRVDKVTNINDTVRDQLRETLREGYDAGETVSELSTRINSTFDMSIARAHVIARTEIAGSVSQGRFSEMTEQGVTKHEWLSARDDHVRQPPASEFDHTIDGETVTIGESFSNGLEFPGSAEGEAGNVINCRCLTLPVD